MTTADIELKEIPPIFETDYVHIKLMSSSQDISLSISDDKKLNENIRNELIIRFLTVLSIDYEKQWYHGMIRRRY
jgi:hypothetical protein